ncbi:MAG: PD40 domain-containing protein, partial [Deltaproteobacteria bacterium]|nr:PD40 domain-containing protein [Deltaproteobacteria bacterium]
LVTDPVFSPDGSRLACLGKEDEKWTVVVDDQPWDVDFDMIWRPVFSPDGNTVAVKAEKKGKFVLVVNGLILNQVNDCMWEPVFSPDGEKILLRAIQGEPGTGKYYRQVIPLTEITG